MMDGLPRDYLVRARNSGDMYGRNWDRNPYALADASGIPIYKRSRAELREVAGREARAVLINAHAYPEKPYILLQNDLSREREPISVAHELAHSLFANANEDFCEVWAQAFVRGKAGVNVDELPAL
ncbi:MAG: ImmA/IrrE family metallo-endopeptidase [Chloroflexi bacterium]|nr:ImmA/IrrE family metallo-endopeptidase [Chloroflexota bacterium]